MTEDDFTKVMAPKVTGAGVLHKAFRGSDLEFFVMFGSAGSVIASPGQGNYAAAKAVLDAFAHYRQAQGLPTLTIGWGPWSVGMVEELKLKKIYAQRGIELITPAAGVRILDHLINQRSRMSLRSAPTGCRLAAPGSEVGFPRCFPNRVRPRLPPGRRFRIIDARLPVSLPGVRKARAGRRPCSTSRRHGF
jgi:hypothetical protein